MRKTLAAAIAAFAATAVPAAEPPSSCAQDPAAHGMRERMEALREQGDRIEWAADPAERRVLIDLQMKKMHEGMRTLRERRAGDACRMEFMQAMLEQVTRHQLAQDPGTR